MGDSAMVRFGLLVLLLAQAALVACASNKSVAEVKEDNAELQKNGWRPEVVPQWQTTSDKFENGEVVARNAGYDKNAFEAKRMLTIMRHTKEQTKKAQAR